MLSIKNKIKIKTRLMMKEPTWGVKVKAGYGREGNSKGISKERETNSSFGGLGSRVGVGGERGLWGLDSRR